MRLSNADYTHYWEKGWLMVPGVYNQADVLAVRAVADEEASKVLSAPRGTAAIDQQGDHLAPRKIDRPFALRQEFRRFVLQDALRDLLAQLLGKEAVLISDQIFMKPPRFGSAKPYHQDNYYFRCSPPDEVMTAWIALDDVDEENGCLRYIEGSHREGIIEHTPVPGEPHNLAIAADHVDFQREALGIVPMGGVLLHHSETMHTSYRNESDRWRRGYATHWGTMEVTSAGSTVQNAIYHQYPEAGSRS